MDACDSAATFVSIPRQRFYMTPETFMRRVEVAFPNLQLSTPCIDPTGTSYATINDRHGVTIKMNNPENPRWYISFHFDDMYVQLSNDSLDVLRERLGRRLQYFEDQLGALRKVLE